MNFDPLSQTMRAQEAIDRLVTNAARRINAHMRAIEPVPRAGECSMTQTACNIAAELCRWWPHVSFDLRMSGVENEPASQAASALGATVKVSWTDGPDVACVRDRLWTFVPGMELERAGSGCPQAFEAMQAVAQGFQRSFGRVAAVHLERGTSSNPLATSAEAAAQTATLASRAIARAAGGSRSAQVSACTSGARAARGWLEQVLHDPDPGVSQAAAVDFGSVGVAVLH